MSIEILKEHLIALRRVPSWLEERGGKRVSLGAVHRWRLSGVRGITLAAVKIGGTYHTSVQALERFVRELTAAQSNGATGAR